MTIVQQRWPAKHPERIQLYSMFTPNGTKVSVALEELGLPYEPHLINIMEGDQHTEEYLTISPNGKIPALLDPNGPDGNPIGLMESGAILLYLAEKTGKLIPQTPKGRMECLEWLFFQVGHIGPMFGQFGHFYKFATEACPHPYPLERYQNETKRLLDVLDTRLKGRDFILGESFSIADCAIFPWVECMIGFYGAADDIDFHKFDEVRRWLESCMSRPSYQIGKDVCSVAF